MRESLLDPASRCRCRLMQEYKDQLFASDEEFEPEHIVAQRPAGQPREVRVILFLKLRPADESPLASTLAEAAQAPAAAAGVRQMPTAGVGCLVAAAGGMRVVDCVVTTCIMATRNDPPLVQDPRDNNDFLRTTAATEQQILNNRYNSHNKAPINSKGSLCYETALATITHISRRSTS
jgi:hypothetical protein